MKNGYTQEDIQALSLVERERLRPGDTHSVCDRTADIMSGGNASSSTLTSSLPHTSEPQKASNTM